MSAPALTVDLHRRIAALNADRARLQLELLGARQVIEARRERDAQDVTA